MVVSAIQDGTAPVSVIPVRATIKEWHDAGSSSIWTTAIKSVVIKWDGGNELGEHINSINVFLQPANLDINKNVWENCAKILARKSDNDLQPYLLNLLLWLEDINWPEAFIIIDRLRNFSGELLVDVFSHSVNLATMNWYSEMWLDYLSGLLDNNELRVLLAPAVLDLLCKHYNNFWGNSADLFR